MEPIGILLPNFPPEILAKLNQSTEMSYEQRVQQDCDEMNALPGNLTGYDCKDCMNRGGSWVIRSGEQIFKQCYCTEIRSSLKRIERSGLADMLEDHTLESFIDTEGWQKTLKQSAENFIADSFGKWFFIGGQNGAGKTHLCTAIVGEFLKAGRSARYMLWKDEVVQLKACVTDDVQYAKLINPLKSVDVLYIDDLFKMPRSGDGQSKPPTTGDLNVAFEIFNARYNNKNLVTIISCEHYIDDLTSIDEAVGSRIYQRTKDYCNIIGRDKSRNYRMKG